MAKFNLDGGGFILKTAAKYQSVTMNELEKEFINTSGMIIENTPIGIPTRERAAGEPPQGNLRHNWQIQKSLNNRYLRGASKKGKSYASNRIKGKLSKGGKLVMFNNAPQIKVVEFGGYTKSPRYGTYYHKSKEYEIRSSGGYSKQAPKGMVRTGLAGFRGRYVNRVKSAMRSVR